MKRVTKRKKRITGEECALANIGTSNDEDGGALPSPSFHFYWSSPVFIFNLVCSAMQVFCKNPKKLLDTPLNADH